jgi:hypothetical protein
MRAVRIILIVGGLISFSFLTEKWYLFESKEFGFTILFPKKPTEQSQNVESAIGPLKLNLFLYEGANDPTDENYVYGVNYTEYPDSLFVNIDSTTMSNFFRGSIDGMVGNVKGELLSEKTIELKGFPGREVKASLMNGTAIIKARLYLIRNKMYMIETITDTKKDSNQSIDKFFNSFQLQ